MAKEELKRSEVEEKYKWDLSCIYKNNDEFYKDLDILKKLIKEIENFKGKINENENTLYEFLTLETKISNLIDNLYTYATCNSDCDVSNSENKKLQSEVLAVYSMYGEISSFVSPELMKTPYEKVKEYISKNDKLKEYEYPLKDIYRYQKYILSDNEEKLLSYISDLQSKNEDNFSVTLNSIIDFGTIKDEDNNNVKLSLNNYAKYIKSKDRNVRKQAFEKRGEALEKYVPTLAIDYESLVKADALIAKSRDYSSSLQMHLFDDEVDTKLYDKLLEIAKNSLSVLHKYFKMRKDVLGYDKLYPYDLGVSLIKGDKKEYSIEEAKEIIINALKPLGEEYNGILKEAFKDRWVDFMPNKDKKAMFYETMAKKGHPLVFANYNDDFESISGVAHELGHAVHSYYSAKNNPSHLSSCSILVAEVASLTNEMILSNYIVKTSDNKEEKLRAIENILNIYSSNFFGTLSEGAVFEKIVHERIYNDETLNEDDFNDIFEKLLKEYYGDEVENLKYSKYNWSRVPHFYTPFYYYKYSVGISGACFVAKKIIDGDKKYLDKYFNFLKLGGSKPPLEELKVLDIDLTDSKVIEEGIKYFSELIDQFIEIYNS